MAETWTERTLSSLGRYINGYAFKPQDWHADGLPIVRIEQINNPTGPFDRTLVHVPNENVIDDGDLVFSWSATLKVVIWRHGRAALNQHLFKVIPAPDVDRDFLYYLLDHHMDALASGSHGSTMKHIKRGELTRFRVPVPSLATQQSISSTLRALDAQIVHTEELIAKQEQVRAGLMQDLFTRGVDESGRLRPTREEAPQLYHETMLGWLPKSWAASGLSTLVPRAVYGSSAGLVDDPNGVPVLRMNNIQAGRIDVSDLRYAKAEPIGSLLLKPGDLLFNRTNSMEHVGKAAIWQDELPKASFASYLVRLDNDPEKVRAAYLLSWLNLSTTQIEMRRYATPGVHQVNINPTNLRRLICPHPVVLAEQDAVLSVISGSDEVLRAERSCAAKLLKQRAGLMHDLLCGLASAASIEDRAA
jgi:type I restriction enzyme, S subunit